MRAIAVFPQKRIISLIEHPEPQIEQSGQVKIRILEVGICGTDKEICAFTFGESPAGSDYLILGHESLGEVVEIGGAVSRVNVGDLVVVTVRHPCDQPDCQSCRVGRQDYCETGQYTEHGIQALHGFLTEFVVEDEEYVNIVPWTLRDVAVLVEPLTIAEKAIARVQQMQMHFPWLAQSATTANFGRGQRAVVLGAGPIGLLGMMLLVSAGFETTVYSRGQAPNLKSSLVEAVGARYVSSEVVEVEQLVKQVGRVDVVYEALGASQIAFEVLRRIGPHGIFVFTGVPAHEGAQSLELDRLMHGLVMGNQAVFGTVNASPEAFQAAIRDLGIFKERWPEPLSALISGRYPLEHYQQVLLGQVKGIKQVLCISSEGDR